MKNPDCFIFPRSKRLIWGRPFVPYWRPLGKSQDSQPVSRESGEMGVNRVIYLEFGFEMLRYNLHYHFDRRGRVTTSIIVSCINGSIYGSIYFVASSKEHICLQSQTRESGDQTRKRPSEQKTEESRADRTKGAK